MTYCKNFYKCHNVPPAQKGRERERGEGEGEREEGNFDKTNLSLTSPPGLDFQTYFPIKA
jgi:hypothetical protein